MDTIKVEFSTEVEAVQYCSIIQGLVLDDVGISYRGCVNICGYVSMFQCVLLTSHCARGDKSSSRRGTHQAVWVAAVQVMIIIVLIPSVTRDPSVREHIAF